MATSAASSADAMDVRDCALRKVIIDHHVNALKQARVTQQRPAKHEREPLTDSTKKDNNCIGTGNIEETLYRSLLPPTVRSEPWSRSLWPWDLYRWEPRSHQSWSAGWYYHAGPVGGQNDWSIFVCGSLCDLPPVHHAFTIVARYTIHPIF